MKKGYLKIAGTILAATLLFTGCAQTGSQSSVISGNDTKILMCMLMIPSVLCWQMLLHLLPKTLAHSLIW